MADVAALCVGVVEVLARLHAPPKEDVVERVRILAARGHDPRGLAKAVAGAAPSAEALLVIDDYQYIAESDDAEAFIEELVTLTDFRLLLTSRERPGWLQRLSRCQRGWAVHQAQYRACLQSADRDPHREWRLLSGRGLSPAFRRKAPLLSLHRDQRPAKGRSAPEALPKPLESLSLPPLNC